MMPRMIDAVALVEWLKTAGRYLKGLENTKPVTKVIGVIINHVERMPTAYAANDGEIAIALWERAVAMIQLDEHGIPFGEVAPDVVKVVRCRDCKHYFDGIGWCNRHKFFYEDCNGENNYCSCGERKNDGNET